MITITSIEEANKLLKQYQNCDVLIWSYSRSLRKVVLRLSGSDFNEVVYIIVVGCRYFHGMFSLKGADLFISEYKNVELITSITDEKNHFKIEASGGFAIFYGVDEDINIDH